MSDKPQTTKSEDICPKCKTPYYSTTHMVECSRIDFVEPWNDGKKFIMFPTDMEIKMEKCEAQTTKCWCLACDPKSGEVGLECRKVKPQTTRRNECPVCKNSLFSSDHILNCPYRGRDGIWLAYAAIYFLWGSTLTFWAYNMAFDQPQSWEGNILLRSFIIIWGIVCLMAAIIIPSLCVTKWCKP